jgi:hypothetical protein
VCDLEREREEGEPSDDCEEKTEEVVAEEREEEEIALGREEA